MGIMDFLKEPEILAQLAEEAAELSQAALKLRRALEGTNPTPVTVEDARENLTEEAADVYLCLEILNVCIDNPKVLEFRQQKRRRWIQRLAYNALKGQRQNG